MEKGVRCKKGRLRRIHQYELTLRGYIPIILESDPKCALLLTIITLLLPITIKYPKLTIKGLDGLNRKFAQSDRKKILNENIHNYFYLF